jgi:hypothetical protein
MSLERRITRLEAAAAERQGRQILGEIAAAEGLTVDELAQEAEAFLGLPLAAQLAEVDRIAAELAAQGLAMNDRDEIKAILVREYRHEPESAHPRPGTRPHAALGGRCGGGVWLQCR